MSDASRSESTNDRLEETMGKIVATAYVSLDGVVEAPGGFEEFEHAGWTFEIDRGEEFEKFKLDETLNSEALLLGRVTYEIFAAAWPSMEGEVADKLNAMPKYVVSSTHNNPEWNNSTVLKGDVVEEVANLRKRLGGGIVIHGSPQLVQTLLEHDLIDELRVMLGRSIVVMRVPLEGERCRRVSARGLQVSYRLTALGKRGEAAMSETVDPVRPESGP